MVRLAGENESKPKWGSAHAKEKPEKRAHAGEKGQEVAVINQRLRVAVTVSV